MTASAPTGEILKFVESFNKEFDKEIIELKIKVDDAKLILASVSTITTLKYTTFPENNTNVKTVGDLYKYSYNFDTAEDLSPKYKTNGYQIDYASVDLAKSFDDDVSGKNLIPKQDLKPLRKKIEQGIWLAGRLKFKTEFKKPQGLNPSLWSPGLNYFEKVHYELKRVLKSQDLYRYSAGFSINYNKLLREGKETFSYSIASFTPDGGVNGLFSNNDKKLEDKYPGYKEGNYTFSYDDGQAGYQRFYEIFRSVESGMGITDIKYIADIGVQHVDQVYNDGSPNRPRYPSLRTTYLTGKVGDFQSNVNFQTDRGYIPDADDSLPIKERRFYGNLEFLGLYKAIIQAGDNYEYVTIPENKKEEPVQEKKAEPAPAAPTASTDSANPPISGSPSTTDKIYVFDVSNPEIIYCQSPKSELYVITLNTSTPYREEVSQEEILKDEYREIELEQKVSEPEMIDVKLDLTSPFEFDHARLTDKAKVEFASFIEKLNKYYKGVIGDVEVICTSSIDSDPEGLVKRDLDNSNENDYRDDKDKSGVFSKKRGEWDRILSVNRANFIVNKIKAEASADIKLNFIPKGIGQTKQYGPGWPNAMTDGKNDSSKTAPNRRVILNLPKVKTNKPEKEMSSNDEISV